MLSFSKAEEERKSEKEKAVAGVGGGRLLRVRLLRV